jgi:hypothetical protein
VVYGNTNGMLNVSAAIDVDWVTIHNADLGIVQAFCQPIGFHEKIRLGITLGRHGFSSEMPSELNRRGKHSMDRTHRNAKVYATHRRCGSSLVDLTGSVDAAGCFSTQRIHRKGAKTKYNGKSQSGRQIRRKSSL